MAVEFICDGCGKRAPGVGILGAWVKPNSWFESWFERSDDDGIQSACSRACIDKVAERSGKTSVVVPL